MKAPSGIGFVATTTLLIPFVLSLSTKAQQTITEIEPEIKKAETAVAPWPETKMQLSAYYEYSDVQIGDNDTIWREYSGRVGIRSRKTDRRTNLSYVEVTHYERSGVGDSAVHIGNDLVTKDAYALANAGFSESADYIYRYRISGEYGHRVVKNVFLKLTGKFVNYAANDAFLVIPGFIWYGGDHYLSADYGVTFIESRGAAQWGVIKGRYALNHRAGVTGGVASGQRLYDIRELDAEEESGYIVFVGADYAVTEVLKVTMGYSYAEEEPDFRKNSVDMSFTFEF